MFNKKRGFTLIELLVVIAIIGILASIVLVSFPSATKKAKDSRVVSAISQARTVMTFVYANDQNYDGFTTALPASDMPAIWTEITNNDNSDSGAIAPFIGRSPATASTASCIYAQLSAKSGYYYCADSTGKAGFTTTIPNTAATCGSATVQGAGVCPGDISG